MVHQIQCGGQGKAEIIGDGKILITAILVNLCCLPALLKFSTEFLWIVIIDFFIKTHGSVSCGQEGWRITPWVSWQKELKCNFHTCKVPCSFQKSTQFLHYSCPPPKRTHTANYDQFAEVIHDIWVVKHSCFFSLIFLSRLFISHTCKNCCSLLIVWSDCLEIWHK